MTDVQLQYFDAITEFAGYRDDCGPCAEEICTAVMQRRAPTTANMNRIRAEALTLGVFRNGNGQNLGELVRHANEVAHLGVTIPVPWVEMDRVDSATQAKQCAALRAAIDAALNAGNPCVLNLGLAGDLRDNERGVHWHFVACGGRKGDNYFIANGDRSPAGGPDWIPWSNITQALPAGIAVFPAHATNLLEAPPVSHPALPFGAVDDPSTGHLIFPDGTILTYLQRSAWLANPNGYGAPLTHGIPLANGAAILYCDYDAMFYTGDGQTVKPLGLPAGLSAAIAGLYGALSAKDATIASQQQQVQAAQKASADAKAAQADAEAKLKAVEDAAAQAPKADDVAALQQAVDAAKADAAALQAKIDKAKADLAA